MIQSQNKKYEKKKIIAFYDLLFYCIISAPLIGLFVYILIFVKGTKGFGEIEWYYILIAAFSFAIPFGGCFFLQKIEINFDNNIFKAFYLVDYNKNNLDINCNWNIYIDQVVNAELVYLNKNEKEKNTSSRFLFNKFVKVYLEYGNIKYVYVAHYSNKQIKKSSNY